MAFPILPIFYFVFLNLWDSVGPSPHLCGGRTCWNKLSLFLHSRGRYVKVVYRMFNNYRYNFFGPYLSFKSRNEDERKINTILKHFSIELCKEFPIYFPPSSMNGYRLSWKALHEVRMTVTVILAPSFKIFAFEASNFLWWVTETLFFNMDQIPKSDEE